MTDKEFKRLSSFIQEEVGIKLPEAKKIMLQSRLQKRLRVLQIPNFKDYITYVFEEGHKEELMHMFDVVSTNKSDFFREPIHFKHLQEEVFPKILEKRANQQIKIWSAGCATGEEPYTLAMVAYEYMEHHTGFDFSIVGTDISSHALQKAKHAIFKDEKVNHIPMETKKKYMLRSKDREHPTVKMNEKIKQKVQFKRLNFMESYYDMKEQFDIIFCRNTLIYFERENQEKVINRLLSHLKRGGAFFLGHSESIMGMDVPLMQIKPTIFQKI